LFRLYSCSSSVVCDIVSHGLLECNSDVELFVTTRLNGMVKGVGIQTKCGGKITFMVAKGTSVERNESSID
jgi:hypothetical protein